MKRNTLMLATAVIATTFAASGALAATVVVSSFAADNSTAGVWGISDSRTGTTGSSASIVGGAPSGDPLGPGAALITTNNSSSSLAEVGVSGNYGTAGTILSTINLAYSYYKASSAGSNASGAPAIKLTFDNASDTGTGINRGFVTLVYEPYWNSGGTVATDTWLTDSITSTTGQFWATGGFGQPNGAGGPPLNTLAGWLAAFNSTSGNQFSAATLVGVEVGIGSNDVNETGYFDSVSINGTSAANTTYNFEPTAVPLPASAWSGIALLSGLGLVARAKRLRRRMA